MVPFAVLLVFSVVIGIAFILDLGGIGSRLRERLENRYRDGEFYERMPRWAMRAFGIWCVVIGIGQFIYFTH